MRVRVSADKVGVAKIEVIKAVRFLAGIGLKEAKDYVEANGDLVDDREGTCVVDVDTNQTLELIKNYCNEDIRKGNVQIVAITEKGNEMGQAFVHIDFNGPEAIVKVHSANVDATIKTHTDTAIDVARMLLTYV